MRRQPSFPTKIDRAHPVGKDVLAFFNAGQSLRFGQNSPTTIGGIPSVGAAGRCLDYASTKTQYPFDAKIANGLVTTAGCAVLVIFDVDTLTGFGGLLSCQESGATNNAITIRIGQTSTDSVLYAERGKTGGTSPRRFTTGSNRITAPANKQVLLFSFSDNSLFTVPTIYLNGVKLTASDVGGVDGGIAGAPTSVGVCLGGRSADTVTPLDGRIYNAWLIGRGVTATEGIALTQTPNSPYALFASQPIDIWAPNAGAGGGSTDLSISDATHTHIVDAIVLVTATTTTVADSLHGHTVDNLTLTTSVLLSANDSTHTHISDNAILVTLSSLIIADTLHASSVDNLTLSISGATNLVLNDAAHAHTGDNLTITIVSTIVIADTLHSHITDNVVLSIRSIAALVIADTSHSHLSDNITLVLSGISLSISDTLHASLADDLVLTTACYIFVADSSHTHSVDNVILNLIGIIDALVVINSDASVGIIVNITNNPLEINI